MHGNLKFQGKYQNYLGNFDKLVMIVMTIKEWLLPKNLQERNIIMDDNEYIMDLSTNYNMLNGIHSSSITITIPANIQPRLHMSNE